jgi:heat shock protein HslJ
MRRVTQLFRSLALLTLLGASLALSGCGDYPGDIEGREYESTEVRGHELVEGSTITMTFEEGRISAQAGCNTLNGAATWDDGTLEVAEPLASTMMACDEALMEQDQWLSEFLTSGPAIEIDGDTVTLGDDANGITLSAL